MSKQEKGHKAKENPAKVGHTTKMRERRAKVVAERKLRKPQPIPQAGRATRRLTDPVVLARRAARAAYPEAA